MSVWVKTSTFFKTFKWTVSENFIHLALLPRFANVLYFNLQLQYIFHGDIFGMPWWNIFGGSLSANLTFVTGTDSCCDKNCSICATDSLIQFAPMFWIKFVQHLTKRTKRSDIFCAINLASDSHCDETKIVITFLRRNFRTRYWDLFRK